MKYMEKILSLLLPRITPHHKSEPRLLTAVDECRRSWKNACYDFKYCDRELVDYMVYKINAAERHYMALLAQAKREGLTAWPPNLPGPIPSENTILERAKSNEPN